MYGDRYEHLVFGRDAPRVRLTSFLTTSLYSPISSPWCRSSWPYERTVGPHPGRLQGTRPRTEWGVWQIQCRAYDSTSNLPNAGPTVSTMKTFVRPSRLTPQIFRNSVAQGGALYLDAQSHSIFIDRRPEVDDAKR